MLNSRIPLQLLVGETHSVPRIMNVSSRGFTLIELLVVVAIIGILSAVALASLGTVRSKGSDASLQTDLSSLQIQAEIYSSNNSFSYGSLAWTTGANCYPASGSHMFGGDTTIRNAMKAADAANGSGSVGCATNGTSYVAVVQMVANSANYWCVDSNGKAGSAPGTVSSMTAIAQCP